jgi:hypothetical protein
MQLTVLLLFNKLLVHVNMGVQYELATQSPHPFYKTTKRIRDRAHWPRTEDGGTVGTTMMRTRATLTKATAG